MKYFLAIDLGASSGRHVVAHQEGDQIILDEVHRFLTGMDQSNDGLVWNIPRLFEEIKVGIKKALEKYPHIESLSIDTWGVDYVLMNGDKELPPFYAYRNERNIKASEKRWWKIVWILVTRTDITGQCCRVFKRPFCVGLYRNVGCGKALEIKHPIK